MVDWDEDGDTDLLVGEYDGHIHYFQNIGTATAPDLRDRGHLMLASGAAIDVSQLAIPVVNDWNEDGRKDLVVGNDEANIKIFLNVGTNEAPVFSGYTLLQTTPAISQIKNAPDIADLNGDGLKDLVFGWWQGTVVYYANSGTNANPVFTGAHELTALGTLIDPGGWTHLELNDWDEDGDLDLVYGEWNGDVYLHLNEMDELAATITPYGVPIEIPAGGGSFDFDAGLMNATDWSVRADAWTVARLPDGSETGALFMTTLTLPAYEMILRQRTQVVPGIAPAGTYEYILRWGEYPEVAWAEDSFTFTKLAISGGTPWMGEWMNTGEEFTPGARTLSGTPGQMEVSLQPNPFNPTTTFRFELPQASMLRLEVFDVNGREIGSAPGRLLREEWYPAGTHEITFDGSNLPSGVYVYRLQAGGFVSSGKMVLMK